jgi:hypothetical protein
VLTCASSLDDSTRDPTGRNREEEEDEDLIVTDPGGKQTVVKGRLTPQLENLSDELSKDKTLSNSQKKTTTAQCFQFHLDFENSGSTVVRNPPNPPNPSSHLVERYLAGAIDATEFEDSNSNHRMISVLECGEGNAIPEDCSGDRASVEPPSAENATTHSEDRGSNAPANSPISAVSTPTLRARKSLPGRSERCVSKRDSRSTGLIQLKKSREPPTVSRAIAILDWAWKQEISGFESAKHREIQLLKEQLTSIEDSCKILSQDLEAERIANLTLYNELDGTKVSLEKASKRYTAAKKFGEGLRNDLASWKTKASSLEQDLDELKEQNQAAKTKLEETRKSCSDTEAELELCKRQYDSLKGSTERRVKELEEKILELQKELSKKVDLLETAQEEIARWQQKAEKTEEIRQSIEAQMQTHQDLISREVVALNSKIDDIQNSRKDNRTEEIVGILQDINTRKFMSPQDMMGIEDQIKGLAGRYVHWFVICLLTHNVLIMPVQI